jgi:hypothetical protein
MKAYLTFVRRKEDDVHMLGISNPSNISKIMFIGLRSGQPVISIIQNNKIIAFYIIDADGNLFQLIGDIDYLFNLNELHDLSIMNLQKYNTIKYFVSNLFECLSIQEAKHNSNTFESIEEKIFYNLLHIEIDLYKIKSLIAKEIMKSDLRIDLKNRLLANLKLVKNPNKKILNKKIDIDLSGYSVKINTFIQ